MNEIVREAMNYGKKRKKQQRNVTKQNKTVSITNYKKNETLLKWQRQIKTKNNKTKEKSRLITHTQNVNLATTHQQTK